MNPQDLAAARRRARETRERATKEDVRKPMYGNTFHLDATKEIVPELASLVDALVGEVEDQREELEANSIHCAALRGEKQMLSERVDELEAQLFQRDMKAAQLPFPRKEAVERICGLANDFMRGGSTTYLELKEAIHAAALSGGEREEGEE